MQPYIVIKNDDFNGQSVTRSLHLVAKAIDVIKGDEYRRDSLIIQTDEGITLNVYLKEGVTI